MKLLPAACSLSLLLFSVASGVFLSRVHRGASIWKYIPMFIELPLALLLIAIALLPQGFPSLFAHILGHPVFSDYTYVRASDGIKVSETWVSIRWWRPIGMLFGVATLVGVAWS